MSTPHTVPASRLRDNVGELANVFKPVITWAYMLKDSKEHLMIITTSFITSNKAEEKNLFMVNPTVPENALPINSIPTKTH